MRLLPPTTFIRLLCGRSRSSVSAFSRNPLGRADTFAFLSLQLAPRVPVNFLRLQSRSFFALASLSLTATLSFLLSCTPQTWLWTVSLLDFLLGPPIFFPTTLSHLIPARLFFVAFSHVTLSAIADTLFFGMFLS